MSKADRPLYRSCPSHCCPIHGCNYGFTDCPVVKGESIPKHHDLWPNNGCERCEHDREELEHLKEQYGWTVGPFEGNDAIEHLFWAWEGYNQRSMSPTLQASRLLDLENAISDIISWHPDFNIETGLIGEPDE